MHRPARPLCPALLVKRARDLQSIWIQLYDGIDSGTVLVDPPNTLQIFLGQQTRGILARLKGPLHVVDRDFVKFEVFDRLSNSGKTIGGNRRSRDTARPERRVSNHGGSSRHRGAKESPARTEL
jgi:hypothetical protein